MILAASAGPEAVSRFTLVLLVVGLALLVLYGVLRVLGRDPLPRGPSPSPARLGVPEALVLLLLGFFLLALVSSIARERGLDKATSYLLAQSGPLLVSIVALRTYIGRGEQSGVARARCAGAGVLICLGSLPVVTGVFIEWTAVLDMLGREFRPQPVLEHLKGRWVQFFAAAVVLAPVVEEVIFRGILFTALKRNTGRLLALVISSLVFTAFHSHLGSAAPLFVLSLLLGWSYERTGTLWTPIAFHAAFNASTFFDQLLRSS